jgi:tetratricopeptide (TPR) repeat protein
MNENSTNTELLIQYLDGELQGEQLEAFQKMLTENKALREELENLALAKQTVNSYGLKNKISSIHSDMMQELKIKALPDPGIRKMIFQYAIRVAVILIVLIGMSAVYQYITVTPDKLFADSFHAFALHETRGTSNTNLEDAYKKEDMEEVLRQFSQLKAPQAEDYFLAGNAYLSTHQPAKAVEAFISLQQINQSGNAHAFEEDAEYYLALSYLSNEEPSKAYPIFEKIYTDAAHPYNKEVSAWFLRKVKRLSTR